MKTSINPIFFILLLLISANAYFIETYAASLSDVEKDIWLKVTTPTNSLGQFFDPITKSLKSISDTIGQNYLARLTTELALGALVAYIVIKMQGSMFATNRAIVQASGKDLITFKDYIGKIPIAAVDLVNQLKNPEKYVKLGIPITKGILLYGPPGGGKTYLARAIAGEVGCPFIAVSGSYFSESLVGKGKKTVQDLFTRAENAARKSKTKTAIIFIDEIDAIGSRSQVGGLRGETEIINTLLSEMDGFYQRNDINVVVIGATNLVNNVDEALRRSGRLDYKIEISYLDRDGREKLIAYFLPKFLSDTTVQARWLADITDDFSPADIKLVFEIAGREALRNNKNKRNKENFIAAVEQVKKSLLSNSQEIISSKIDDVELGIRIRNILSSPAMQREGQ